MAKNGPIYLDIGDMTTVPRVLVLFCQTKINHMDDMLQKKNYDNMHEVLHFLSYLHLSRPGSNKKIVRFDVSVYI